MNGAFCVSVDPYAWLKPSYARLRSDPGFARLAPASQFAELCRAASEHSAPKAASMREWNATTQAALLTHLANSIHEHPNPSGQIELWRVRKHARTLRCVAMYLSHGILVEASLSCGEFHRRCKRESSESRVQASLAGS